MQHIYYGMLIDRAAQSPWPVWHTRDCIQGQEQCCLEGQRMETHSDATLRCRSGAVGRAFARKWMKQKPKFQKGLIVAFRVQLSLPPMTTMGDHARSCGNADQQQMDIEAR